jgi:hypothetical protein
VAINRRCSARDTWRANFLNIPDDRRTVKLLDCDNSGAPSSTIRRHCSLSLSSLSPAALKVFQTRLERSLSISDVTSVIESERFVRYATVISLGNTVLRTFPFQICPLLTSGSARRVWSIEQAVPYLINGNQWTSYDDVQSLTGKVSSYNCHTAC